jgi:hypothetical protein
MGSAAQSASTPDAIRIRLDAIRLDAVAPDHESVYNRPQPSAKESPMKMVLAAILAGAFLASAPVKAADKADDTGKADKPAKKAKADKGDKADKKDDKKPAAGGW